MKTCRARPSLPIELYFYGELPDAARAQVEHHLGACPACRQALEELSLIRAALAARPDVAAPPDEDWAPFMARLQAAVEDAPTAGLLPRRPAAVRSTVLRGLAAAALLAVVTFAALLAIRDRGVVAGPDDFASSAPAWRSPAAGSAVSADDTLVQVSEAHFERAKLVVLGLSTKDPLRGPDDWTYERGLAASLLDDTRLYRRSAEQSGMTALADVMRDLEVVLLQTAMSEAPDATSLAQLQRLIRRRDLITKMNVVASTGLLP